MIAAAHLLQGLLNDLEGGCRKNGNHYRACQGYQGQEHCHNDDGISRAGGERSHAALHFRRSDGIQPVLTAHLGNRRVPFFAVLVGVGDDIRQAIVPEGIHNGLEVLRRIVVVEVYSEVVALGVVVVRGGIRNSHGAGGIERASCGSLVEVTGIAAHLVGYKQGIVANVLVHEHGRLGSAAGGAGACNAVEVQRAGLVLRLVYVACEVVDDGVDGALASAEHLSGSGGIIRNLYEPDGVNAHVAFCQCGDEICGVVVAGTVGKRLLHRIVFKDSVRVLVCRVNICLEGVTLIIRHLEYRLAELLIAVLLNGLSGEHRIYHHRDDGKNSGAHHQHGSDLHKYSPFPFSAWADYLRSILGGKAKDGIVIRY